ncbi:hypothetical protein CsSME_00026828 [Camellia sinensis var. sinensis]
MVVSNDHHSPDTSLFHSLNSKTPFLGLRLYLVIELCFVCLIIVFVLILLWLRSNRSSKHRGMRVKHSSGMLPLFYKDVSEIKDLNRAENRKIGELEKENKAIGEIGIDHIAEKKGSSESNVSGGSQSEKSSEEREGGKGLKVIYQISL